jgi:hypothetical protein
MRRSFQLQVLATIISANDLLAFMMSSSFKRNSCLTPELPFSATSRLSLTNACRSKRSTALKGIDFDALADDEECDFFVSSEEILRGSLTFNAGGIATLEETQTFTINPNCIELPTGNADIIPEEVVNFCMNYLQANDEPRPNSGLEVCFNFSSDSCRAANGGCLESFLQHALNPVFQSNVDCHSWEVLSVGSEISGTITRGAMKTVLVKVVQKKGARELNDRKFLWTMMKERRPPRQGFWLVHECIAV